MRRISPVWLLVLGVVWWVLALPRTDAWVVGLMATGIGAGLHAALGGRSGQRFRVRGFLAFVPFFVDQSVRGGWDVAKRALSPSLPLAPGFVDYRTGLPAGPARIFFVNCISLLPGTFSARFEGRSVRVHLLTVDGSGPDRLSLLERKVAALFGVDLAPVPTSSTGGGP